MTRFPIPSDERTNSGNRRSGRRVYKPHHGTSHKRFRALGPLNWHRSTVERFQAALVLDRAYLAAADPIDCADVLNGSAAEMVDYIAGMHGLMPGESAEVTADRLVTHRFGRPAV